MEIDLCFVEEQWEQLVFRNDGDAVYLQFEKHACWSECFLFTKDLKEDYLMNDFPIRGKFHLTEKQLEALKLADCGLVKIFFTCEEITAQPEDGLVKRILSECR